MLELRVRSYCFDFECHFTNLFDFLGVIESRSWFEK